LFVINIHSLFNIDQVVASGSSKVAIVFCSQSGISVAFTGSKLIDVLQAAVGALILIIVLFS
jgi:hypothetical protein